jgi:hypothetical protein
MAIVANTNGSIFPLFSQFGTLLVGLDIDIGSIGHHFSLKVSRDDISETLRFFRACLLPVVDIQSAPVKMTRADRPSADCPTELSQARKERPESMANTALLPKYSAAPSERDRLFVHTWASAALQPRLSSGRAFGA